MLCAYILTCIQICTYYLFLKYGEKCWGFYKYKHPYELILRTIRIYLMLSHTLKQEFHKFWYYRYNHLLFPIVSIFVLWLKKGFQCSPNNRKNLPRRNHFNFSSTKRSLVQNTISNWKDLRGRATTAAAQIDVLVRWPRLDESQCWWTPYRSRLLDDDPHVAHHCGAPTPCQNK